MVEKTLSRINPVTPENAGQEVKELYNAISKSMGKVPNIFANMGNSPIVLQAVLSAGDALNHTSLNQKLREKIALIVAQTNDCTYCLSAHSFIGKNLGLQQEDILAARKAESEDPKTQAILKFVKTVVQNRGKLTNDQVAQVKSAGVNDKELTEILFAINVNMFTNYFNNVVGTELDFPEAPHL